MPPEMVEIAAVKYSGVRLGEQSKDEDFDLTARTILARICAATGWQMADNEFMRKAIISEFTKYCAENCKDMTVEEVLYAIRHFGLGVQDWGKNINLQLINQPVLDYLAVRISLSELEEQAAESPKTAEIDPGPVDWSDTWEKLKSGEINGVLLGSVPYAAIYDWLVRTARINPTHAERWAWINQARENMIGEISLKREAFIATSDEKALCESLKVPTWNKNPRCLEALVAPAKVIAVLELLTKNNIQHENIT